MPISVLKRQMSSSEFTEWLAYDQIEPFGAWRDDVRIGVLGASLAPLLGDFKGRPPTPEMFMPKFGDESKSNRESPDAMYQKMLAMTIAAGGKVNGAS